LSVSSCGSDANSGLDSGGLDLQIFFFKKVEGTKIFSSNCFTFISKNHRYSNKRQDLSPLQEWRAALQKESHSCNVFCAIFVLLDDLGSGYGPLPIASALVLNNRHWWYESSEKLQKKFIFIKLL
jgi:hypothetical protein